MNTDLINEVKAGNWERLHLDILFMIITRYLSREDIMNLCLTSKTFNAKICTWDPNVGLDRRSTGKGLSPFPKLLPRERFESLWKQLYERDISALKEPEPEEEGAPRPWNRAYKEAVEPFHRLAFLKAIKEAARRGDEKFFETEEWLEYTDRWKRTDSPAYYEGFLSALMEASGESGSKETIDMLLATMPEVKRGVGRSDALSGALKRGHLDLAKELVTEGAIVKGVNLYDAVESGDAKGLDWVMSQLPPGARYSRWYLLTKGSPDMIKHLFAIQPPNDEEAIVTAAKYGDEDQAITILARANDEDITKELADAAISTAARNGHTDLVRMLIGRGADIENSIYEAATEGHTETLQLLLDEAARQGQKIDIYMARGAASNGHMDTFRQMLPYSDTAKIFSEAIHEGYPEFIDLYNEMYPNGKARELSWLAGGGQKSLLLWLIDVLRQEGPLTLKMLEGAIRGTIRAGYRDLVETLLNALNKDRVRIPKNKYKEFITLANERGMPDIAKLLTEHNAG